MSRVLVNGVEVSQLPGGIQVVIETDTNGDELCPVHLKVVGGRLDVYSSQLTYEGPLHLHLLREDGDHSSI